MAYKRGRSDYATIRDEANDPATKPIEVSAEEYHDMLEMMPPIYVAGGFLVCEPITGDERGNVYAHYAERGGRFFARYAVTLGGRAKLETLIPLQISEA